MNHSAHRPLPLALLVFVAGPALAQEAFSPPLEEPLAPQEYGTQDVGYTEVYAHDVFSSNPNGALTYTNDEVYCQSGTTSYLGFARIPPMPEGAEVVEQAVWGRDESPTHDIRAGVAIVCYPTSAAGDGVTTFSAFPESSGTPGFWYVPFGNTIAVNNRDCSYILQVTFNRNGPATCAGDDVSFQKFRLSWQRRVSPAPLTATFADVPTSHPFFQQIEALTASGITSGCGGGNFCPSGPLTRGQIAVFLAKALGLHWPISP